MLDRSSLIRNFNFHKLNKIIFIILISAAKAYTLKIWAKAFNIVEIKLKLSAA